MRIAILKVPWHVGSVPRLSKSLPFGTRVVRYRAVDGGAELVVEHPLLPAHPAGAYMRRVALRNGEFVVWLGGRS